jgi:glycosyltransferase involved in cell wall biosynthesis
MPSIRAAIPNARLLVVGSQQSEYAAEVKIEAERLQVEDRIIWAGSRNDIHRVLAALDLYVLPSREENLPLSILEAMASGCAVVASAVGGVPECVLDQQTGLLVPPADPAALAQAVIRLLHDAQLREEFGVAGQQRVQAHFSRDGQVDQIERIFAHLAAPSSAPRHRLAS